MIWIALVTLVSLLIYAGMGIAVGRARGRYGVAAPAMTGHPVFERMVRVQANTLEWLVLYLPALWLFARYVSVRWAVGLGVVWCIGRILYWVGYARDPAKRGVGFAVQALAALALLLGATGAVVWRLLARG